MHSPLSSERQQELADRILERAELAQMARKLKMGLGKVVSPKKGCSSGASSVGKVKRNSISEAAGGKTASVRKSSMHSMESPTKKARVNSSSTGHVFVANGNRYLEHDSNVHSARKEDDHLQSLVPSTPRSQSTIHKDMNEEGADLLMYLATSPYASTGVRRMSISTAPISNTELPTTPKSNVYAGSANSRHDSQSKDITRLSHIKDRASSTSPQSTFKHPTMVTTSIHDMINSPSVSMFMSPRRNLNDDNHLLAPGTPSRIGLAAAHSHNDQLTDSHAKIGSLLKTPSFNMGDYVHTLFSPSPRIDISQHDKE